MKKLFIAMLTLVIICSTFFVSFNAFADDVYWHFDDNSKTLYVNGTGNMQDYSNAYSVPWYKYINQIEKVVIENGITSVGAYAFAGASYLTCVNIPDSVTAVNQYAFSSCKKLLSLKFSNNIVSIADCSMAFDGVNEKENFKLYVNSGSYSLFFAIKNDINFSCDSVTCSTMEAKINPSGMIAYFPYYVKTSGIYKFYSTGVHDTYGYVYDSNFKKIKSNDDASSSNTNYAITVDLEEGNTYYFAAKIYNSTISGTFNVILESVNCTVKGCVYALENQQGDYGNYPLTNATVNGGLTVNGSYSLNLTSNNDLFTFECNGVSVTKTISVDDGSIQNVALMMCDTNFDGVVNGKDYAKMLSDNSTFIPLFENFANYKY